MKRFFLSTSTALTILLATSFVVAAPSFRDRMAARKLGAEAKQLLRRGKDKEAAKKFKKADSLSPAPSYKLELAKILLKLEDYVQSSEVLEECMDQGPIKQWVEKAAQKKCIDLASDVDDQLPRLAVVVIEPSAEEVIITIDDEDYDPSEGEVGFNPGKYKITAEADGYKKFTKRVKLKKGDHKTIEITLKGARPEKKAEDEVDDDGSGISPVFAYVAWGIGAAGVGMGIAFGISAIQTTNEVLSVYDCENGECPAEAEDDLNVAILNGNLSTTGFIVGGAGIALGTVLYLLADTDGSDDESGDEDDDDDAGMLKIEARPMLGPGFVGVTGSF